MAAGPKVAINPASWATGPVLNPLKKLLSIALNVRLKYSAYLHLVARIGEGLLKKSVY